MLGRILQNRLSLFASFFSLGKVKRPEELETRREEGEEKEKGISKWEGETRNL